MATIGRRAYAEMFGPTVGDRLRLADTDLVVEVEANHTLHAGMRLTDANDNPVGCGVEVKSGGGRTIRNAMAQSQKTVPRALSIAS